MQLFTNKKQISAWAACLTVIAAALPAAAGGAVQMVTYFPVPYAQYETLKVTKLDIGTIKGQPFTLNIGVEDPNKTGIKFEAKQVNLNKITGQTPTLAMKENFSTTTATFGANQSNGSDFALSFNQLYLKQLNSSKVSIASVEASTLQNNKGVKPKIAGNDFPTCSGTVRWGTVGSQTRLLCCGN